jgi:hypothetical protein
MVFLVEICRKYFKKLQQEKSTEFPENQWNKNKNNFQPSFGPWSKSK